MSFFGLPLEARQRIYAYTGLVRSCPIDILCEGDLKRQRSPSQECVNAALIRGITTSGSNGFDCHCPDLPVSILRVCRQVYEEASAILYGSNDLMVLSRSTRDLQSVLNISRKALSHTRSLLIRLNCWPCLRGHDLYAFDWQRTRCIICDSAVDSADPLLSLQDDAGKGMIKQWSKTCAYLSSALSPHQVHLALIADVDGIKVAQAIVTDLQRLPILKKLDIRLGRYGEPALRDIASNISSILTDQYRHPGSYPFERLPEEIRMRILEFTGLGPTARHPETTFRDLRRDESVTNAFGSRGRGRGSRSRGPISRTRGWPSIRGRARPQIAGGLASREQPAYHDRSHIYRLREVSRSYGETYDELFIRENRISKGAQDVGTSSLCCRNCTLTARCCCCRDIYAASSAYCTCRLIHTGLFHVSKTFYRDATRIFYSQNAFIFHQDLSLTVEFLRALAPSLLGLIRDITIKPTPTGEFSDEMPLASGWRELVDIIYIVKEKVQLKTLSFTLDTTEYWDVGVWSEAWELLYAAHCNAARDMQALQGLKNLKFRAAKKGWNEALTRLAQGGSCTTYRDVPDDN